MLKFLRYRHAKSRLDRRLPVAADAACVLQPCLRAALSPANHAATQETPWNLATPIHNSF